MVRNRSKQGMLAVDCPERINKWLDKLRKLEKIRASMLKELELPRALKIPFLTSPEDSCDCRIGNIKEALKSLKNELRELEKKIGISRKQSKVFGGKGNRSKADKLTKGRN